MGSLGHEDFILIDNWPGVPLTTAPAVPNGYDSTNAGNDATTPMYPPGTKHQRYQDSTVGAGGTHVANTEEVGHIQITGHESKGKINKRLRIALGA